VPLLPIFIVFFIGSIAETNRAPFDLAEAESELVSGFMTEHSAVIFVFFFLAEYASIVLICILNSILFLGGYLFDFNLLLYPYLFILKFIEGDSYMNLTNGESNFNIINFENYNSLIGTIIHGIVIGLKACMMIFTFI
jgi:NADH-ubiquinone oxidoreductase chain 1